MKQWNIPAVWETVRGGKFRELWKHYLLQSLMGTATIAVLVLILGQERTVLISVMGATTFIVFAMPTNELAKTKNVIGGHLIGFGCGAMFYLTDLSFFIEYPIAAGLAILLMVVLDVEHPPAAGTALAVVINEVSCDAFVTVMLSALVISQCRYYLRRYLKDLV